MNIVSIPYHDWRKISKEGARTRDSHFIENMTKNNTIQKVIVLNRPTSYVELLANRYQLKLEGTVILKKGGLKLYKLSEKLFVIDFITNDLLMPVLKKKLWFFDSFAYHKLISFYKECLEVLSIQDPVIFSNNIFSIGFAEKVNSDKVIFDAYDNLVYFPHNNSILDQLVDAYKRFSEIAAFWTTNSTKNLAYYKEHYNQDKCYLIKNGVDINKFQKKYEKQADMKDIQNPVIGFGGKITHLFDYELFNYIVKQHPDKNFILVGQILDKEVFNKILKADNVYYLGDKHYDIYTSYVCNFDLGIIPYVTNHLESGVDSIKVYEYIAAGLSTVGTTGGGIPDLAGYLYVANNKEEFSDFINLALSKTTKAILPEEHTWEYKVKYLTELVKEKLI